MELLGAADAPVGDVVVWNWTPESLSRGGGEWCTCDRAHHGVHPVGAFDMQAPGHVRRAGRTQNPGGQASAGSAAGQPWRRCT